MLQMVFLKLLLQDGGTQTDYLVSKEHGCELPELQAQPQPIHESPSVVDLEQEPEPQLDDQLLLGSCMTMESYVFQPLGSKSP